MNCKPGDLAYTKNSDHGNSGIFCHVVRAYFRGDVLPNHRHTYPQATSHVWVVESIGRKFDTGADGMQVFHVFKDSHLIPIRPGEQPEETEVIEEVSA